MAHSVYILTMTTDQEVTTHTDDSYQTFQKRINVILVSKWR